VPRLRIKVLGTDQRGFTLPELLTAIAILGILIAIAVIIWLGILERRRVDAATNQLAADLRLAHTNATEQFTDWRVVLVPGRADEDKGPDYYLVKLNGAYDSDSSKPSISSDTEPIPRTLPANVKVMVQENTASKPIQDDPNGKYYLSPDTSIDEATRTLEFNSDGTMTGYGGSPSGTVRVTIDDDPQGQIRYISATSRIRILP
jgi:prepilin-type N-terminal cleavage/methylation domain-containing protein